jgi:tRNA(Ile)-lysidine synthase
MERWRERGWGPAGTRVAVACSGGLDSLVLLHLFRFSLRPLGLEVDVAHFDHRMRPESGADAEWISELAKRWGIGLHLDRATTPPHDEASARALRYIFLEGLVRRGHVERVLTAHHSDDQVETVLFRIVRGVDG